MLRSDWSRRECLGAALAAVPVAWWLRQRAAAAQDFAAVPIPPDDARGDVFHPFWDSLVQEFPLAGDIRHFNTAGLGIAPLAVLDRVRDVARDTASQGDAGREHLDFARRALARFVHAEPDEISLVRNATEAMNIVARGLDLKSGDEIVLSTHEHPGGAAPWVALHQDTGVVLRLVEPRFDADADAAAVLALLTPRTRVVVLSHVVATIGARLPVERLAPELRSRRIFFVVDGAQAVGIMPVDVTKLGADCYLASGHKWLLGPVETGFLHVRRDRRDALRPRFAGVHTADASGWDLESGRIDFLQDPGRFEYGTRSPSQAAGLAAAVEWIEAFGLDLVRARALGLAQRFAAGIASLPGIQVLTPQAALADMPVVTFRVTHRPQTQVVDWLWKELRMRVRGVSDRRLDATRASFHFVNRTADVDWFIEAVRTLGA